MERVAGALVFAGQTSWGLDFALVSHNYSGSTVLNAEIEIG
jgi:hypothetical protein